MPDEKDQQFTRMWNEENTAKRQKFRNLMKSKLDLLHVEVTEENARAFYNGRLRGDGESLPRQGSQNRRCDVERSRCSGKKMKKGPGRMARINERGTDSESAPTAVLPVPVASAA